MNSRSKIVKGRVLFGQYTRLLYHQPTHAMANEHDPRILIPPNLRTALKFLHQRLSEVVDVEQILPPVQPVRIVPKAVNPDMSEVWISRKPFLRPIMCDTWRSTPCLSRSTAQSVDKYQINEAFGRFVEEVETQVTDRIHRAFRQITSQCQAFEFSL